MPVVRRMVVLDFAAVRRRCTLLSYAYTFVSRRKACSPTRQACICSVPSRDYICQRRQGEQCPFAIGGMLSLPSWHITIWSWSDVHPMILGIGAHGTEAVSSQSTASPFSLRPCEATIDRNGGEEAIRFGELRRGDARCSYNAPCCETQ